jgi:hypothetical protein
VKDDDLAEEVADEYAYDILIIASGILKRRIHTVVVLPSILSKTSLPAQMPVP